jgi:trafficking protein particle complex subunit 8
VILAVSTMTSNPSSPDRFQGLHATPLDLSYWVDPAILKYTLVIHPEKSNLSDEECVTQSTNPGLFSSWCVDMD